MITRREFGRLGLIIGTLSVLPVEIATLGCQKVLATLATVLAKFPSAIAILNTGLDLAGLIDPTLFPPAVKTAADALANKIALGLGTLQQTIQQYQADLSKIPSGALAQVDAAVAAIESQLSSWEKLFNVGPEYQQEASLIADTVNILLTELASLLPPPKQTATSRALMAKTEGKKVVIVGVHDYAHNFNVASKKRFPTLVVAEP